MAEQLSIRSNVSGWAQQARLLGCMLVVLGAFALGAPALPIRAQGERCFAEERPEITACISGRFLEYWEANNGLSIFGYPLTRPGLVTTPDGTFVTQYFERARFELHPDNPPPYDVLLGRLGAELRELQGRAQTDSIADLPADGCQFWPETQHNVCGPFLEAWRAAGIRLDDNIERSDAERLALWGLPITGIEPTTTAAGIVLVQVFERARIEQQPNGTISFGRLGIEVLQAAAAPEAIKSPAPPPVPTALPAAVPQPSISFPGAPCNVNVPAPAEGLQLWMADATPSPPEDAVACVRLIVGGEVARGANAVVYRYRGDQRRPSIPQSTGHDGVASFIFYIGEEPAGTRIPVEAVVTFRGMTHAAYSEFTPQ